jgi:phage tail sheath protein FI
MPTYKTPDVYVEEISVFPPSVAEVETAIPAFIGHTEKAKKNANELTLKPTKIYSLKEFEEYYGHPKDESIAVTVSGDAASGFKADAFTVNGTADDPLPTYLLYYAVKMFFDNGGGKCYIVSVGDYADNIVLGDDDAIGLKDGLDAVALEDEPTLIVIPEAVKLSAEHYASLMQAVLMQCDKLRDRFGIFDIRVGTGELDTDAQTANRAHFGNNFLKYGAAYYPFIKTTMNYYFKVNDAETESNVDVTIGGAAADLMTFRSTNTTLFNFVKTALQEHFVKLPPSGAVAGVYAMTDTNRGVWKAPANVSLANVIEPLVRLDNARQDDLNVDVLAGKSINALRAFAAKGTLVWGARTLAGNDNEWRYINVRRFFNMVEESVKKSTYWAVFEPNDANTWVKVRGMIENFLTQKWREGALAGATTKDAFFVKCGLGTTMTAQDILEGRMNVEIGMAAVRPAEFIILKFSHKLQTS